MEKDSHMNIPQNSEKMIRILKVKQKGKTDKYEVTFSKEQEEETVLLLEDQIVNFRILKNKEYLVDEWIKILESSNTSIWFNKCLHYISFKNRTIKEIENYLGKNDLTKQQIKEIINRLLDIRLLNDEQYAYDYLEEIIRKKKGLKYFKYQLESKGVSTNVIDKVARDYPENLIINELVEQVQKHQKKLFTYPVNSQKQKINDKLLRDGFSNHIINIVFNQINWNCDIRQRIKQDLEKIKKQTDDNNKITQKLLTKGYNYQDIKKHLNK